MSEEILVDTYAAKFRLMMSADPDVYREHGELVPEAHTWFRLDSWLHTGKLSEVKVTPAEFKAAVKKYCPDQMQALLDIAGVSEDIVLMGERKTPTLIALRDEPKPAAKTKAKAKDSS